MGTSKTLLFWASIGLVVTAILVYFCNVWLSMSVHVQPEEAFRHYLIDPIPPTITAIKGGGKSCVGETTVFLMFTATESDIDSITGEGYESSEWKALKMAELSPESFIDDSTIMSDWQPGEAEQKECCRKQWADREDTGVIELVVDKDTLRVYCLVID